MNGNVTEEVRGIKKGLQKGVRSAFMDDDIKKEDLTVIEC